jgi:HSP20 family protein
MNKKVSTTIIATTALLLSSFALFAAENTKAATKNTQPTKTVQKTKCRKNTFACQVNELQRIQRMMDQNVLNNRFFVMSNSGNNNVYPKSIVQKNKNGYVVQIVTPGMNKSDISIKTVGEMLTITGKNTVKKNKAKAQSYSTSDFSLQYKLQENIAINKIASSYKNGVLNITIPIDQSKIKKETKIISIS